MVDFTDTKELEAWLRDSPPSDAVLIAARAALRVLPLTVVGIRDPSSDLRRTIILPIFRAMAFASFAGTWPKLATGSRPAAAARSAAAAAHDAAHAAADAAPHAAARSAAFAAAAAAALDAAADAARSAAFAAAAAHDAARSTAAADAIALDNGHPPEALAGRALWLTAERLEAGESVSTSLTAATPTWIEEAWALFQHRLAAAPASERWDVWIDWYQARLDGAVANADLDRAIALIDPEIWDAGPEIANAEVARLVEEHSKASKTAENEDPATNLRQQTLDQLIRTDQFAFVDFEHDEPSDQMVAIAFPGDLTAVVDDGAISDRRDLLSTLRDATRQLAYDIRSAEKQVPKNLRTNLIRYGREVAKPFDQVRSRALDFLGKMLIAAARNDDTRHGLNELVDSLDEIVILHNKLIATYYSEVLNNRTVRASHGVPAASTPDVLDKTIDELTDVLSSPDWAQAMPRLPEGVLEDTARIKQAMIELQLEQGFRLEEEKQAQLRQALEEGYVGTIATLVRLIDRTILAAGNGHRPAGVAVIATVSTVALAIARAALKAIGLL